MTTTFPLYMNKDVSSPGLGHLPFHIWEGQTNHRHFQLPYPLPPQPTVGVVGRWLLDRGLGERAGVHYIHGWIILDHIELYKFQKVIWSQWLYATRSYEKRLNTQRFWIWNTLVNHKIYVMNYHDVLLWMHMSITFNEKLMRMQNISINFIVIKS